MKARALVSILILVLAVLIVAGSCATFMFKESVLFCFRWNRTKWHGKLRWNAEEA